MRPNPRRMADVIRMPGVQGGASPAATTASVDRPEVDHPEDVPEIPAPELDEATAPQATPALSRDKMSERLAAWEAPVLSDEIVETMATIFLMQPGRELMPFFLWLDGKMK